MELNQGQKMFADFFIVGCSAVCFYSTYMTLKLTFFERREHKKMRRKLEMGEILNINTVLNNIERLEKEAVTSWTGNDGKKHHLLVVQGLLHSTSSLPSDFNPRTSLLVKVV